MSHPGASVDPTSVSTVNRNDSSADMLENRANLVLGTPIPVAFNTMHTSNSDIINIVGNYTTYNIQYGLNNFTPGHGASRPQNSSNTGGPGVGFDKNKNGNPFFIRAKGTANYLTSNGCSKVEGIQLILHDRSNPVTGLAQKFVIDNDGALTHVLSGLQVDIMDDVPCLRRRRSYFGCPNPWAHPLPEFSFINSQIHVKFLSDPAFPSCTDALYPGGSWATNKFLLATQDVQDFHLHKKSDFVQWIPANINLGSIEYSGANPRRGKGFQVLVERMGEFCDPRTSWEIVPA